MGDEAIHAAHCSVFRCVYGDPGCPVAEVEPGEGVNRSERALAVLRDEEGPEVVDTAPELAIEYAVRNKTTGWVYALPKVLPKFLDGKRGTREVAEWHRRQVGGPDPEDQTGFEIVSRPVGPWEVAV